MYFLPENSVKLEVLRYVDVKLYLQKTFLRFTAHLLRYFKDFVHALLGHTFYLAEQLQVRCYWPGLTAAYVLFGRAVACVLITTAF